MRWMWLLVLFGCGSKDAPPSGGSATPSGSGSAAPSAGSAHVATGSAMVDAGAAVPPPPAVAKIEQLILIENAAFVRTADGSVYAWGANKYGEVGDGTTQPRLTPTKLALTDVVELAAKNRTACSRHRDGSVQCWGSNEVKQLADPKVKQRPTPAPIPSVTGATRIFVDYARVCASVADAALVCWGLTESSNGLWSERHEGETAKPTIAKGLKDVVEIDETCVRHSDGSVTCWNLEQKLERVKGVKATQLADWCAVLESGKVTCWGLNSDGCRLGSSIDTTGEEWSALPVPLDGVRDAVQTFDGACALTKDGAIWCRGGCDSFAPRKTKAKNIARVANRCALLLDGTVACAAKNLQNWQERIDYNPKPVAGPTNVRLVADTGELACAVGGDTDVWCWGDPKKRGLVGDGGKEARKEPVKIDLAAAK